MTQRPPLKRVCAWCNEAISEARHAHDLHTVHEAGDVTHDICSICSKAHFDVKLGFEKILPHCAPHSPQEHFRTRLTEVMNSRSEVLPAAETPLGKLWELVNSDVSTIDDCVRVIELDPALTTRVFRLANSAAFGGHATKTSEAVLFLGFARIRQVAFTAGIFKQFSTLHLPAGWEKFWMRNLFVARVAERLASTYFRPNGSEYLAGLLHDVGWLLLSNFFPEEFSEIFSGRKSVAEMEREILPFSHADIAAAICSRSLLPLRVVNAVAHHHSPITKLENSYTPEKSARFLGAILNVSDRVADHCELSFEGRGPVPISQVEKSPEAAWLGNLGPFINFEAVIREELPKTREIYSIFFEARPPMHKAPAQ